MRRKTWLIVLGVVFLLIAGVYCGRDPLASWIANFALGRERDVRCTPVRVAISAGFDTVTVAPLRCTIDEGPMHVFSSSTPATISLRGLEPQTIRVERAYMDQRERDVSHVHMNTLAELADIAGITSELAKSVLDSSETYAAEGPALYISELTTTRGGKGKSVMHGFRSTYEGGWDRTQGTSVSSSAGVTTTTELDQRVTSSRGVATLKIYLGKRERGSKPNFTLQLSGEELNTRAPHVQLSLQ